MLNMAEKVLERLLKARVVVAVKEAGDLSNRQYGFRKGRCTIDAIQEVITVVKKSRQINHFSRNVVLLVTFDVKNAFNSVRWPDMLNALEKNFKMPEYLLNILKSYLSQRTLFFETSEGMKGGGEGSVLGPDLWNITYDGILRMKRQRIRFSSDTRIRFLIESGFR